MLWLFAGAVAIQAIPQREDCWGKDQKCSDGKYRDPQGKVQPESCDNFAATGKAEVHNCACEHTTECQRPGKETYMSEKCSTYCRPKACTCAKDCS
jgi:hypothetical protein